MRGSYLFFTLALAASTGTIGYVVARNQGGDSSAGSGDFNKKIISLEQREREAMGAVEELRAKLAAKDKEIGALNDKIAEERKGDIGVLKSEKAALTTERDQLKSDLDKAKADHATAAGQLNGLQTEKAKLDADLAAANTKIAELTAKLPKEAAAVAPILFGKFGDKKAIIGVKWGELGRTARAIRDPIAKMMEELAGGKSYKDLDPKEGARLNTENAKLVEFAAEAKGALPSHVSTVNGAYTHPIATANLISGTLAEAGKPLNDQQRARFTEIGENYVKGWDAAQGNYTEETYKLVKLIDELDLKSAAYDDMLRTLTPDQAAELTAPQYRNVMQYDLYSPVLMLITHADAVGATSREALQERLIGVATTQFGFTNEALKGAGFVFGEYLTELEPFLKPQKKTASMFYRLDHAAAAGHATIKLMQKLSKQLNANDEQLKKLRECDDFPIPCITTE